MLSGNSIEQILKLGQYNQRPVMIIIIYGHMDISQVAKSYIGQTEKPMNKGFNDQQFEIKMKKVGFEIGNAWCALFTELVAKEALPQYTIQLDKLFSASAVQTFKNFQQYVKIVNGKYLPSDLKVSISAAPVENSIVIWQHYKGGKPDWTGHAGIVTKKISDTSFNSIEGNTNDVGGREGYIVASKKRTTVKKEDGLNVLGFIIVS
jgi:hypothetical protein